MSNVELYKALHQARKKFSTVVKNGTNPHFKSKYADLESILDAVEKPLDDNNLLIITRIQMDRIETDLIHVETGQKETAIYPLNPSLTDQQKGSAITYGRRYNIQSLLNLVAEDDDGHGASKKPDAKKPEPKPDFDPVKTGENSQKFIAETDDYGRLEAGLSKFKAMESMFKRSNTMDIYTETVGLFNAKIQKVKPHE